MAATGADGAPKAVAKVAGVTEQDIARRAHDLFLARGCEHGRDVEDWLQAEQELLRSLAA